VLRAGNGVAVLRKMMKRGHDVESAPSEAKVASDPEDLIAFFGSLGFAITRIGLEAGPLSQWAAIGSQVRRIGSSPVGDATCKGGVFGNDYEDRP